MKTTENGETLTQGIRSEDDRWGFEQSDAFADFSRADKIKLVGHYLVWAKDDRTDEWIPPSL